MGCCYSTPSDAVPYPTGAASASSHAINAQQPAAQESVSSDTVERPSNTPTSPASPAAASTGGGSAAARRRRRSQQPLDQHINKPLRLHTWTSKNRRWTRASLDRERAEFFDTRVTGRAEIWQTLHAVLQVLWDPEGEGASGDGSGGLGTAQSMLDAAEITLPTGNLAHGAYDNLGNYYAFHEWIISDPANMATGDEDDGSAVAEEVGAAGDPKDGSMEEMEEVLDDEEVARRREEKGKAVVDVRDLVTVCARLSENSRDIRVSVGKGDAVRLVARKILEESGLPNDRIIRIAYMGKMLKDNASLSDQGWVSGHVINALVFPR